MSTIELAGETVTLLPERALWWPRASTLFIADPHFGKAAAFRASGLPVPEQVTGATLERLSALCERIDPEHLVFLGDFIHHRRGWGAATLYALLRWREKHARLAITLVRGNHDRHGGDPPAVLRIDCVDADQPLGPFVLLHEPAPRSLERGYGIAGHVHPAIVIQGRANQRVRLPCFLIRNRQLVLPAFGEFTGYATIVPVAGDQVFAVADDRVLRVPTESGTGGARGG